jgi:hypothetical protein
VVYTVMAWVVLGSFPLGIGVWWCVCVVAGSLVMWSLMQWQCQRLELQDIALAPLAATAGQTAAASAAAIQVISGGVVSSATTLPVDCVRSPPSIFAAGATHHHHRSASGLGLLATTSPHGTVGGLNASGQVLREPSPAPIIEMTPNSIKRR